MKKTNQKETAHKTEEELDAELEQLCVEQKEETQGERFYARKFKNLYIKIRKTLVVLAKARKSVGSQAVYEKALIQIQKFLGE